MYFIHEAVPPKKETRMRTTSSSLSIDCEELRREAQKKKKEEIWGHTYISRGTIPSQGHSNFVKSENPQFDNSKVSVIYLAKR
jgi:hypothetical protein